MKVKKLKGTCDFYGETIKEYRYIEKISREVAEKFGFTEIQTPVFELTDVFLRSVGESSDIVNKEMYTFLDRSENSLTLRPEGTAGVSRAYVENKMYANPGLTKLYYFEPMFRCERPQLGRYRQFTQFGVEALGAKSPYLDADVITLGAQILKKLGLTKFKAVINTLGSKESREVYQTNLKEYFTKNIDAMCDDCKERLNKNPLRILDCKVDRDSEVMKNAPTIEQFLSDEDKAYFDKVIEIVKSQDINYSVDSKLVRGLDYYSHTVFEFVYDDPNSKLDGLTLFGGGRYSGLSSAFSGPETDAIGLAIGVERIMLALRELNVFNFSDKLCDVVCINIGESTKVHAISIANYLRSHDISVDLDYVSNNLKPQFKLADRTLAENLIIIGEDEVNNNTFKVKNTITKEEQILNIEQLSSYFNIEGEKYAYKK